MNVPVAWSDHSILDPNYIIVVAGWVGVGCGFVLTHVWTFLKWHSGTVRLVQPA